MVGVGVVLDDTDADVLLLEAADADVEALVVTGVEVAVNPVLLDDVAVAMLDDVADVVVLGGRVVERGACVVAVDVTSEAVVEVDEDAVVATLEDVTSAVVVEYKSRRTAAVVSGMDTLGEGVVEEIVLLLGIGFDVAIGVVVAMNAVVLDDAIAAVVLDDVGVAVVLLDDSSASAVSTRGLYPTSQIQSVTLLLPASEFVFAGH